MHVPYKYYNEAEYRNLIQSICVTHKIVIITDEPGWHGVQLREAFVARHCKVRFVSLVDCGFDLDASLFGVQLPGFNQDLPGGVFVRGVPGGRLEEVILYLDVLHALRVLNVPVYNDARAIERSVDKCMTSFLLKRAGIPTPPTWVISDRKAASARLQKEVLAGHELVFKPLFGSQGKGLQRLSREIDLPDEESSSGVYYLQRFIETGDAGWYDWRVFVIGGQAVSAMRRTGKNWISNVANGGCCQGVNLDVNLRQLAENSVNILDMQYAGVDILRDTEGQYWVVEVNSIPAWKGLQSTHDTRIADLLADDFLRYCHAQNAG